jgi:hypothetical protein
VHIILLVLLSPLSWSPLAAQTRVTGPAVSVLFEPLQLAPLRSVSIEAPRDTVPAQIRPTYWKEGLIIGGLLGGISGALLGHGLCEDSDSAVKHCTGSLLVGGLLGAAILGIPGALIGGQFPKQKKVDARPNPG